MVCCMNAGCAGSALGIANESPEELKSRSNEQLCMAYNASPRPAVKAELVYRKALTEAEWQLVEKKTIAIGMSKPALICSWGVIYEGVTGSVNTTIVAGQTNEQWVYRESTLTKPTYVYLKNGFVTAIQN